MARLRVLSTLGLAGLVRAMMPEIEAAEIVRLEVEFQPTAALLPRLRRGEVADVVLLTEEGIEALLQEGIVQAGTEVGLARSFIGMAVKAGAPHPEIGTQAACVAALRAAPSLAMSRRGASGLFLAGLFERMGLAAEIGAKAVIVEEGFTAALAADGRVALALQQVSELLVVPGIEIVGRLPPGMQQVTVFAGAVLAGSEQEEAGVAFLRDLAGAGPLLATQGLDPA